MRRFHLILLYTVLPCILFWPGLPRTARAVDAGSFSSPTLPFGPGEKLTYELRWEFIPAGEAVIQVLPQTWIAGKPATHFLMTIRSNRFADIFYKVRDRIESHTDPDVTRALLYRKKQREGDHHRDIEVSFDWSRHTALYRRPGKEKTIPIFPGTFDPLSIYFHFRLQDFTVGDIVTGRVSDGKKCVLGTATVVSRETIEVPAGTFDTLLVEPELEHIGGVFRKSPDAKLQIWVTNDVRHIPVMIKSKVVVGSFAAVLTGLQPGEASLFEADL